MRFSKLIVQHALFTFIITALNRNVKFAFAIEGLGDSSIGIAFTSNQSVTFENPAALAVVSEGTVSPQIYFPSNLSDISMLEVSVVKGFQGFGLGGGLRHSSGSTSTFLSLGAGISQFQAGLTLNSPLPTILGELDFGIRGTAKNFTAAFVVKDVTGPPLTEFTLGLGFRADIFGFEPDLEFNRTSGSFEFTSVSNTLGFLIIPNERVTFKVIVTNTVVPEFSLFSKPLELGIMFWINKNFGVQAGINAEFASVMLGCSFHF